MSAPIQAYHHPVALRDDYETPEPLYLRYHEVHDFTLDAAANASNAKCVRYFTPEIDGLAQDWGRERVWLNPPYGKQIGAWMRKAAESAARGALVVALIPSRTDSGWWHDFVEPAEYEHLRGRIKFVGMEHNAPFPCSVVTFRPAIGTRMGASKGVGKPGEDHAADGSTTAIGEASR